MKTNFILFILCIPVNKDWLKIDPDQVGI